MFKPFAALLLIAAAAAPALAAPDAQKINFSRDGYTYVGTVITKGSKQLISGEETHTGTSFDLQVANGHVTGHVAGEWVSYPVPAGARHLTTAVASTSGAGSN